MESSSHIESLKDWALAKLGEHDSTMSVTEATLRFATEMLESLNASQYLDEEGVTSSFLGLILGQLPWTTLAFAEPSSADACYWSHYGKHGKKEDSESRSGADFALVLRSSPDEVRVALFQAKREKDTSHPGEIQVHQWPVKTATQKVRRDPQFKVLMDKARSIMTSLHRPSAFDAINWVYYLGLMTDGLRCIPLKHMESSRYHVDKKIDIDDWVKLTSDNSISLLELLTRKSSASDLERFGWLPMSLVQARTVLPSLLEFSDIFIIDERKGGPTLELKVEGAAARQMSFEAAPSEFKIPPPPPSPSRHWVENQGFEGPDFSKFAAFNLYKTTESTRRTHDLVVVLRH